MNRIAAANVILQRGWGDVPRDELAGQSIRFIIETHPAADREAARAYGVLRMPSDPAKDHGDVIDAETAVTRALDRPNDEPQAKGLP